MPIEEPIPHGKTVDVLRNLLAELRTEARHAPHDARIAVAIGHLSAAMAVLELPSPLRASKS